MRVYVAGSSKEIPRVRAIMTALRLAGHVITHDWTPLVERFGSDGAAQERALTPADLAKCAAADIHAIDDAERVVMLWPRTKSEGAYVELGIAIGIGRPVTVSGGDRFWCALLRDEEHRAAGHRVFDTDEEAIASLCGEAA